MEKELLDKIFESTVLTEESKNELKEAFTKALAEAVADAKTKAEQEVKAELSEQFVTDKEALIEALETKVEEFLKKEVTELEEDIQRFRDVEVEFAEKLVEARKDLAEVVKRDMAELIEGLDTFLELRLRDEFTELHEDIREAKQLSFGRKVFEGIVAEYKKNFQSDDDTYLALEETKAKLEVANKTLAESVKELKAVKREKELIRVLEPLTGHAREVMETILQKTQTEKLEETYKLFIGKVLHEGATAVEEGSEKDRAGAPVLAEGDTSTKGEDVKVKIVTGDNQALKEEDAAANKGSTLSEAAKRQLQRLAGIDH